MTNELPSELLEDSCLSEEQPSGIYEPPQIETVLTADELSREIQYAGVPSLGA